MAYQAKRRTHYTEQLELVDESGRVAHTLVVDLEPGEIVGNLSNKYIDLLHAKEYADRVDVKNPKELIAGFSKLAQAVTDMIEVVFGPDQTKIIFEFYQNKYNDIIVEIVPFISNVVVPQVRKLAQENKKEILKKYNRKQRRFLQKRMQ